VGWQNCTALHLAEFRATFPGKRLIKNGAPFLVNNQREWVEIEDIDEQTSDFEKIGESFENEKGLVTRGQIGMAESILTPQRNLVDYAVAWMETNRRGQYSN
jgi:aminoglycoside 3-N-acetyltransferase